MSYLVPAANLKKQFETVGSFYSLRINDKVTFSCRNMLEIYDRKNYKERPANKKPDALFVMMNPGSAEPIQFGYRIPEFSEDNLESGLTSNQFVKTKPDQTIYQIMRVMMAMDYQYARIINLSDIRCGSSDEFRSILPVAERFCKGGSHRIFSHFRIKERTNAFNIQTSAPVVLAWGQFKFLEDIAQKTIAQIPKDRVKGIVSHSNPNLFYHARQIGMEKMEWWLSKIIEQL